MLNKMLQDLLLFTFVYFSFVGSECSGIYSFRPCCVGEKWDESLQKCSKCPAGHYGVNCSLTCDIPYYGYRCSSGKCACNRISCQISTACHTMTETKRRFITRKTDAMERGRSTKNLKLSTKSIQRKGNRLPPSTLFTEASTTLPRNTTDFVKENNLSFPYILGSIILVPLLFVIVICSYKHATLCCEDMFSMKNKRSQKDEIHFDHDYEQTDRIYVNTGYCHRYDIIQENDHQSQSSIESEASYESLSSLFFIEIQDKNYDDVANVI